jgi:ATP-dependent DNA helicase RecG
LQAVAATDDGFKLAELDLQLRGPGEIYGARQHGELDLRLAKLDDAKLIARARGAAEATIKRGTDLLQYPRLSARIDNLRKITNLN